MGQDGGTCKIYTTQPNQSERPDGTPCTNSQPFRRKNVRFCNAQQLFTLHQLKLFLRRHLRSHLRSPWARAKASCSIWPAEDSFTGADPRQWVNRRARRLTPSLTRTLRTSKPSSRQGGYYVGARSLSFWVVDIYWV